MSFAVEIENVSKHFGDHMAVRDLSLRVPTGSIYGFIGPNGSGKTTTLRLIMRILHPDRGRISVLGSEALSAANDRIGYLPEERGLYRQMKVRELLRFYCELKGHRTTRAEIDGWLERIGLAGWGDAKVSALSKGMSQKVQFVATVIARPQLVLLDEPFSGLDPINGEVLRDLILDLRRQGVTVIFSTHDMSVAEQLCDSIFMIFRGTKMLDGTLREIQNEHGRDVIHLRIESNNGELNLNDLPGVAQVHDLGNRQELRMHPDADRQALLAALMARGNVELFEVAHPSLQDIFMRIAGPEAAVAMRGGKEI